MSLRKGTGHQRLPGGCCDGLKAKCGTMTEVAKVTGASLGMEDKREKPLVEKLGTAEREKLLPAKKIGKSGRSFQKPRETDTHSAQAQTG